MTQIVPRSIDLPTGPATVLEAGSQSTPTVLLLHGGGLDCARLSWRFSMPPLSSSYRVIAPNWPGYAGTAALWSALHHPGRVEAIVPVGTYGIADRAPYHVPSCLLTKLPLNALSYALMRRYPSMLRRAIEAIFADRKKVTFEIIGEVQGVLASAGHGEPFSRFERLKRRSPRRRMHPFT